MTPTMQMAMLWTIIASEIRTDFDNRLTNCETCELPAITVFF